MIDYQLLTLQNPWWTEPGAIEEDPKIQEFKNSVVPHLPRAVLDLPLANGAIHIVLGPRQTGKSTALKLLIQKLLKQGIRPESLFYFNCDALETRRDLIDLVLQYQESLATSENIPVHYLLLDEVSSLPNWPYAMKWLQDAGKLKKSKIILTGSSSLRLTQSGEFLPGRRMGGKDILFLPIDYADSCRLFHPELPLTAVTSFHQLERLQQQLVRKRIRIGELYQRFLLTGGILKILDLTVKQKPYAEAVELYLSTLKSELAKFGKKETHARHVLNKVITSLTSETSYANVAEEAELGSKNTAADYLSFFGGSFLLNELLFYSISERRVVLKKNKKYYPTDPFFLWIFQAFVTGNNDIERFYEQYRTSPLSSQLAENFVASQLYKHELLTYFFKSSKELDFYIPSLELGIEVKYKERIVSQDLAGLKLAKRKVLVCKQTLQRHSDIVLVPVSLFGFVNWKEFEWK